jgi:HEPN domain-containing protein
MSRRGRSYLGQSGCRSPSEPVRTNPRLLILYTSRSPYLFSHKILLSKKSCMNCKANLQTPLVDSLSCNSTPPNPIDPIIQIVRDSMSLEKVFLLGTYPIFPPSLGPEYDILVLINSHENRLMNEYESLIANRCHDLARVTSSVFSIETINCLLRQGNVFFSVCCAPSNLLFDGGLTDLEKLESPVKAPDCVHLKNEFLTLFSKARSFLSGAVSYRISGDNQLAAFMLHQTVEQGLNAFLTPLIGYRLQTHNLNKLLIYARRLSCRFYSIFPRDSDKEIQLYQTLHKAYIYGRYRNNFQVGLDTLFVLIERATALLELVELLFHEKIESIRKEGTLSIND